jgi:hypothetical protein
MIQFLRLTALVLLMCEIGIADEPSVKALLKLHLKDALDYSIARDSQAKEVLEFQSEPVFTWTNPVSFGLQTGHIFLWTYQDRPEAIGTIFSVKAANTQKRMVVHEFHTLSEKRLYPKTPAYSDEKWEPKVGIVFNYIDQTSVIESNSNSRLRNLKAIARTFEGETVDQGLHRRQLRLLTTPLIRYEPKTGVVVDGALFAMVSSDGTDPEVLLMVEAIQDGADKVLKWRCAALRFSDKDIIVKRNGMEVWSSLKDANLRCAIEKDYRLISTPQRDYMCYRSHDVDELVGESVIERK